MIITIGPHDYNPTQAITFIKCQSTVDEGNKKSLKLDD